MKYPAFVYVSWVKKPGEKHGEALFSEALPVFNGGQKRQHVGVYELSKIIVVRDAMLPKAA